MNCPKCNFDNEQDAIYCEKCGTKLIEEKLVCPNCGTENNPNAKFCKRCGMNLNETEVVTKQAKPVTKTNNGPKVPVLKIIAVSLIGFALSFVLIGMFTTFLKGVARSGSNIRVENVYMIPYIFSKMFKELQTIENTYGGYYAINLIFRILVATSYVCMLIGVAATTALTIVNIACNFKKKDFSLKYSVGIIASILPFILISGWVFIANAKAVGYNSYTLVEFGGGSVLLIISMFIILIANVLARIDTVIKEKNTYALIHTILYGVAGFFLLIMVMTGFGSVLSAKNSGTITECSGSQRIIADYLRMDLGEEASKGLDVAVIGTFLTIASMIFSFCVVPTFIKKPSIKSIIFMIIGAVLIYASIILFLASGPIVISSTEKTTFGISANFVMSILLAIMAIGAAITGSVFEKKMANKVAIA